MISSSSASGTMKSSADVAGSVTTALSSGVGSLSGGGGGGAGGGGGGGGGTGATGVGLAGGVGGMGFVGVVGLSGVAGLSGVGFVGVVGGAGGAGLTGGVAVGGGAGVVGGCAWACALSTGMAHIVSAAASAHWVAMEIDREQVMTPVSIAYDERVTRPDAPCDGQSTARIKRSLQGLARSSWCSPAMRVGSASSDARVSRILWVMRPSRLPLE